MSTSSIAAAWANGLRPEPELTVSEWADRYRMMDRASSAEPGRWRTDRTPYLREIMDALSSSSDIEEVVLMKGTQIGATEAGNNWLGYVMHHAPGPMLYVQPTIDLVKRTSRQRIAPMIEASPELRARVRDSRERDSGNTMLLKEFPGGILICTGANSAVGLRSMPARYVFFDEVDKFVADVEEEGDPIELARKRTDTFAANRKIFEASTPTVEGFSRIEKAFRHSDQRYYYVPCPHCGHEQIIQWGNIKWETHQPETAMLFCEGCGVGIEERHKTRMLAAGVWKPTAKARNPRIRGYHLSALYSPLGWFSWAAAADQAIRAKRDGPESMKTFVNTVLGECSTDPSAVPLDDEKLFERREPYGGTIPEGVLVLTVGVDTQDDRLHGELVGWGIGEEAWSLDYRVFLGDPEKDEVWESLTDWLNVKHTRVDGVPLVVSCACIDSGGHKTQHVYRYVQWQRAKMRLAVKGVGGMGKPIVGAPSMRRFGRGRRNVDLYPVGSDQARATVQHRLAIVEPGPGYCHFPMADAYGPEYFRELTAMRAKTRRHRGIPAREWELLPGRRKEAFDCRQYALAALYILNPVWPAIEKRRAAQRPDAKEAAETSSPKPEPKIRTKQKRKDRRNWVTRL